MKWISVDDELPERGKDVLIYEKHAVVPCVAFLSMAGGVQAWCANTDFYEVYGNGEIECKIVQDNVTHWMPLPDAPIYE